MDSAASGSVSSIDSGFYPAIFMTKTVSEWSFVSCARHPARVFFCFLYSRCRRLLCISVAFLRPFCFACFLLYNSRCRRFTASLSSLCARTSYPVSSLVFVNTNAEAPPDTDKCGCSPCGMFVPCWRISSAPVLGCYLRCCFWLCLLVRILSASGLA